MSIYSEKRNIIEGENLEIHNVKSLKRKMKHRMTGDSSYSVLRTCTLAASWHINYTPDTLESAEWNSPHPVTLVNRERYCG